MKSDAAKTLTFHSIFFSYSLVCVILLGITGAGYMGLLFNFKHEQERQAGLQARELSLNVSKNIQQAYQIFDILETESLFRELAAIKRNFQSEEILRAMELKQKMGKLDAKNDLYQNLHIYFAGSNSILSTRSQRREGEKDIAFFCREYGLSREEFGRMMRFEDEKYYTVLDGMAIWFFQPVYQGGEILAVMFAEYSGNLLLGGREAENIVLLHTESGENLLCKGRLTREEVESFDVQKRENTNQENAVHRVSFGAKKYIGICADVNLFNMTLYMVLPETMFLSQFYRLLFVLLLEFLLMAAAAALLSWHLSKKMYIPVGNLIRDNRNLNYRIQKNSRLLENMELAHYLEGAKDSLPDSFGSIKERLIGSGGKEIYQMAVILPPQRADGIALLDEQQRAETELEWLMLKGVLDEWVFSRYPGIMIPVKHQYAAIVCTETSKSREGEELKHLFRKAMDACDGHILAQAGVMISQKECGFAGMRRIYQSLLEGLLYLDFWNAGESAVGGGIYIYGEMMQSGENVNFSDYINGSKKLLNCLESEDFRGADRELNLLYKKTFPKEQKYLKYNLYRMYGLIGILISMLNSSADEEEQQFYRSLNYEERLFRIQSIHELISESHMIFERIIRYKEERTIERRPEWMEEMTEYIRRHFAEVGLNVSSLAEQFGISVPHLSRSFKIWMGMGALEYIHRIRIEHAKEMLKNDCSVKNAASASGYGDVQAFTRAFKRYEGVAPGQYKDLMSKNEA